MGEMTGGWGEGESESERERERERERRERKWLLFNAQSTIKVIYIRENRQREKTDHEERKPCAETDLCEW